MSDSTPSPDIDPEALRKLMQNIQGAYELQQVNEQLRRELIEAKQKLEDTKEQKGLGLHFDRWFFVIGKVRQWSDDYLTVDYSSGTIEFECQSPDDLYKKDMVIAVLEYKDDGWVAMFVEKIR